MSGFEKYSDLKKELMVLEKDRRYFFMKRYYLFRGMISTFIILAFFLGVGFFISIFYQYNTIEKNIEKNKIFITSATGDIEVTDNNADLMLINSPGEILYDNYLLRTGNKSECVIQIKQGYYLKVSNNTSLIIKEMLSEGIDKPFRKIFIEKGFVSSLSYQAASSSSYWIETPSSYISVKDAHIDITVISGGYYTDIKVFNGNTIITPKTLYTRINIPDMSVTTDEWMKHILKVQNVKFVLNKNERIKIPKIIDLSINDYIILKHILKKDTFTDEVKKMFFIDRAQQR